MYIIEPFLRYGMGKIKAGILAIMLLLGFVLQNELFFEEAWNFNTGYYLSAEISCETQEERKTLLEELYQEAEENQVEIFAACMAMKDEFHYELQIYGNSAVRERIARKHGIAWKTYQSLRSGEMEVRYEDFMALQQEEHKYITTISFMGDEEDVWKAFSKLQENDQITSPVLFGGDERDVIWVMWGMIALLLVVMTCVEIMYCRKSVIVQISMGRSVWAVVLKSVIKDIFVDFAVFFLMRTVVFHFIAGEFMRNEVLALFSVGVAASCLCYLTYAVYDIKKAFSNVTDFKGVLYTTYLIKFVVTVLSVGIIVTNLSTIKDKFVVAGEKSMIEAYGDYSYLTIRDVSMSDMEEDGIDRDEQIWQYNEEIYRRYYQKAKPAICANLLEDVDRNLMYLLVNENAKNTLEGFVLDLKFDETAEMVLFVPEAYDNADTRECVHQCLYWITGNIESTGLEVVPYTEDKSVTYIDSNATYGMKTVQNPVILFWQNPNEKTVPEQTHPGVEPKNVMYHLSEEDMEEIEHTFHLEENGYELSKTSVADSYEYHKSIIKRGLYFCSSVCFFALFLQFLLLCVVNRMEYRMRSMELALKRVLGYSAWKKNARAFFFSIGTYLIILIGLSVIGRWLELYRPGACIAVGGVMLLLEIIIIEWNIVKIERKGIAKTLKGGCL